MTAVLAWFGQRLQDLFLWPINLVRDFPVRASRLGGSWGTAVQGLLFLLPELLDALRHGETGRWLRFKAGRVFFWLHAVLAQLFDLAGGPEIIQIMIRPWAQATPLSATEMAALDRVFAPGALRTGEIRILQGGLLNLVFQLNGNLAFAAWRTVCLPTDAPHARHNLPLLIHELTHVYQYERIGSRYLGEAIYMLIKTRRDCYHYGGPGGLLLACATGTRLGDFNREQQAMIAQDFFTLLSREADWSAYEPFIRELREGHL